MTKVVFSTEVYDRLVSLKRIVSDKRKLPGERRLAMREFDRLFSTGVKKN